ncbi:MAG: ankyrin repeat domain-containing protein [Planctomycetota bacterium]
MKTLLTFAIFLTLSTASTQAQTPDSTPEPLNLSAYERVILGNETIDINEIKDDLFNELLFDFVHRGRSDVVNVLIENGVDLEIRNVNGQSILHVAAWNGSNDILDLLIDRLDDVNLPDESGRSPLHSATLGNNIESVRLLIEAGASVDGIQDSGSPLLSAAWWGQTEIANYLIANRADIHRTDSDGNTALHKAVWQGNVGIVERLLSAGADPGVQNNAGMTPVDMADDRLSNVMPQVESKRSWGTEQAIGEPDSGSGDDSRAWASETQDGQNEWLIVHYENPVIPVSVEIYENLAPGAVNEITLFDEDGEEHSVWTGNDPAKPGTNGVHVALISLETEITTRRIRVHINSKDVVGWNEVDAVGLIDGDGKKQWATWVEASSCYASGDVPSWDHRVIQGLLKRANE